MNEVYAFLTPYGAAPFTKAFSTDDAALVYAGELDDSGARTSVFKLIDSAAHAWCPETGAWVFVVHPPLKASVEAVFAGGAL